MISETVFCAKKEEKKTTQWRKPFCCNQNNFSGYFCTAEKQRHYQLILTRRERESCIFKWNTLTLTGCIEFFPFFILEAISLWWALWYTLVISNLVHCIVYFSTWTPCTSEKITVSHFITHFKANKWRQLSPSEIFLL